MKRPLLRSWRSYHKPPRIDVRHDAYLTDLYTEVSGLDIPTKVRAFMLEHISIDRLYNDIVRRDRDHWRSVATALGFAMLMLAAVVGWAILIGGM